MLHIILIGPGFVAGTVTQPAASRGKIGCRITAFCIGTATDGRILRDRVLSGFGVRLNALSIKAPGGGAWSLGQVQRVFAGGLIL